jgi:hypothetical protein
MIKWLYLICKLSILKYIVFVFQLNILLFYFFFHFMPHMCCFVCPIATLCTGPTNRNCILVLNELRIMKRKHWLSTILPISTNQRIIIFQLYRDGQIYWWRTPEYPEKTADLSRFSDKLYHILLLRVVPPWTEFELTIVVVIGTDYINSYKSNYHTTTTVSSSFGK